MFTRSEIRHACYRAKKDQPANPEILSLVKEKLSPGEDFKNFSINWDLFLDKNNVLHIIKPETNYEFAHSVCLEKSICVKNNMDPHFEPRQENVVQIVELNMLSNMSWETYNKTWGISIDYELKRIYTKLFKTVVNEVTFPIQEVPVETEKVTVSPLIAEPITKEEGEAFLAMMRKKKLEDLEKAKPSKSKSKPRKAK
jgi:hypothetical protein